MSLNGTYDPGNIFARILRGEAPCAKVFEDAATLAFMDVFPQSPGHTLVIPKTPARNLLDLPESALGPTMLSVQRIARAVARALEPDGVRIMQFNGAPSGQTVFHVHVHIIPVWEGKRMLGHGAAPMARPEDLAETAARIAACID